MLIFLYDAEEKKKSCCQGIARLILGVLSKSEVKIRFFRFHKCRVYYTLLDPAASNK